MLARLFEFDGRTAWRVNRQGTLHEASTGLDYSRNRDYSPTLQRWVEADPLGFGAGDVNFYRAEGNSPTNSFGSWDQVFSLNAAGTMTVQKFGHSITRQVTELYGTGQ